MKTLIVIPSAAKTGLDIEVSADRHPTMDYQALASTLRGRHGDEVDLLDYSAVEQAKSASVRFTRKFAGLNAALALMAFQRHKDYDAIFTNAENVAVPLALMLKTVPNRPRHVTIAHRISAKKKLPFYRWLQVHREMDTIFLYASKQLEFARDELGIPDATLRQIPFHADHRFYRPLSDAQVREDQICSAGLEWRDYPTLINAMSDRSDVTVRLAAASPWSKHNNETDARPLPAHIDARCYDYNSLRDLYAESSVVVVPLYDNDFQAGVTTILEAMAMGKPVVVTSTEGQNDIIDDGYNGLYVEPGRVEGWRQTIELLRNDPALRRKLGQRARRWVEENATLDHWVENVTSALRAEADLSAVQAVPGSRQRVSQVYGLGAASANVDVA